MGSDLWLSPQSAGRRALPAESTAHLPGSAHLAAAGAGRPLADALA